MSIALKAPELQLSEEEAAQYAKAVASVGRHYDMGASAKTLDWFNLGTTMASIYGVRVMAIAVRRKSGRPAPATNGYDPTPPPEGPHVDAEGTVGGVDWSLMVGPGARPQ